MSKNIFLAFLIGFWVVGCTTTPSSPQPENDLPPNSASTPASKPKKKPAMMKAELFSLCKISNGAGRVFQATDSDQVLAEAKARHECEIYSRTCIFLDCYDTTQDQ